MKKRVLFLLAVVMLTVSSFAQVYQRLPAFGYDMDRILNKKGLSFPKGSAPTLNGSDSTYPAIMYILGDSTKVRFYSPETKSWHIIGSSSGVGDTSDITNFYQKVRSLFSATGPVLYSNGNFSLDTSSGKIRSELYLDTKYPRFTSSYSDPSWISDLAWSKISGAPDVIDSMRRLAGSTNVQARKNGVWITQYIDSVGSGGGGGSPAGNYGNVQLNRNGSFATPGSDSLDFDAGLIIKGILSASALPTGGVDADSVVVINSSGAFKKRNVSAFARMNTTSAANQLALFNGNGTLYSSSKFVFSDATYPSMSIVGSDPLMYFGGTGAAYPSIGKSGNSLAFYGPSTGKSIGFYDQLVGGKQMLRLYTTSGSVATFNKTAITLDTAVGGPSIGSVHVEYNAGDSTSAGTDVGRHMFRGIGRTYANAGSFNTFYSTVEAGNTTYSQDHIISWQSDAKKTGANTLNIIYHLGILGDSIKAGTVNNRWGVYMYDAKVTPGATLAHQSALRVPKLASAVRNYDMFSDSAQTVKMDGNFLIGDSSLATGARKTIHLFNGTAPSSNISGSILYSESGEFKIRNGSGAINTLSGNAVFSGTIKTADPGSGAGAFKFGTAVTSSGLVLKTTQYVEISIDGTVYRLALVDPPTPQP